MRGRAPSVGVHPSIRAHLNDVSQGALNGTGLGSLTVAKLPAVGSVPVGTRAIVTDSSVTIFLNTVAAGGASIVPVFNNGTNWVVG